VSRQGKGGTGVGPLPVTEPFKIGKEQRDRFGFGEKKGGKAGDRSKMLKGVECCIFPKESKNEGPDGRTSGRRRRKDYKVDKETRRQDISV